MGGNAYFCLFFGCDTVRHGEVKIIVFNAKEQHPKVILLHVVFLFHEIRRGYWDFKKLVTCIATKEKVVNDLEEETSGCF